MISCRADSDRDALLFTVEQTARACHTPTYSCFGQRQFSISGLAEILQQLIVQSPEGSYTAKLASDLELLRSKITEEAHEVIRADNFEDLRWEIGDALYHLLVLTLSRGLRWSDIESELRARQRRI